MKTLFLSLAFIFAASNASASATKMASLTKRVNTASSKARTGKTSEDTSKILMKLAPGVAMTNLKDSVLKQAEEVVKTIELAAKENDGINGLSKEQRIDALEMIFVNLINNNGKDEDLVKLYSGPLFQMLVAPSNDGIGPEQYAKFIKFNELVLNGTSPENASIQATKEGIKAFATACEPESAASRR